MTWMRFTGSAVASAAAMGFGWVCGSPLHERIAQAMILVAVVASLTAIGCGIDAYRAD